MKKFIALFFAAALLLLPLAGCGRTDAVQDKPASSAAPREAAEPVSPEQAIAAATTPEELRSLIAAYQTAGDNQSIYLAAKKLIGLDPADTQAYQDAITALLGTISGDYDEIQSLVTQGIQNAPDDAADFVHWANAQKQSFSFAVPFVPDYTSEGEINTVGSAPGNLTNFVALSADLLLNGLFTAQGDWVYFLLPADENSVYKMRLDGTALTKVGNARGSSLNVVGDWLYYKNLDDGGRPYRIRTDGTQIEGPLFNNAVMMSVTKDWIYYCDGGLYKTRTDGSETVTLLETPCAIMALYDGWIYYNTGGDKSGFFRISAEGGAPEKLLDGWTSIFTTFDGWIYYMNNVSGDAIWRMRPDGSEAVEFYRNDYPINSFTVSGGKLAVSLCMVNDDRGKPYPTDLVVIDIATGAEIKALKKFVASFYETADSLFYFDETNDLHSLNLTTYQESVVSPPASTAQSSLEMQSSQPQQGGQGFVGNTSANLFMQMDEQSTGLVAGQGEQIYFASPRDEIRLYSASENGASLKKMLDERVSCVNLAGKTLYFCNKNNNFSIESIGIDGQNRKMLLAERCDNLSYADGWLYCRTNGGIAKIPAAGGEEPVTLLTGKFRNIYASDGWVYYIEDHEIGGLWRIPVDGGEPQKLLTDHPAKFYAIEGDRLYLLIDGGDSVDIIRMKLDGSDQKKVFSLKEKIHAINISNRRLIVVKDSDSGSGFMALILDPDKYTVENKIDGLLFPCVYCVGSDVYDISGEGFVRQNLDTGEQTVVAK